MNEVFKAIPNGDYKTLDDKYILHHNMCDASWDIYLAHNNTYITTKPTLYDAMKWVERKYAK